MRNEMLRRYEGMTGGQPKAIIELALVELAGAPIMMALIRSHAPDQKPFDSRRAKAVRNFAVGQRPTAGQADLRRLGLPLLTIAASITSSWPCLQRGVPPITRFAMLQNLFPSISSGDRKTEDIQVLACNDAVIRRGGSVLKL